jgi:hypothetical protein
MIAPGKEQTMNTTMPREITLHDLGNLCLRATVALAARCARRVRPMMDDLPDDFPDKEGALAVLDTALSDAENYARANIIHAAEADANARLAFQVAEAAFPYRRLGAYAVAHAARAAAEAVRAGERASEEVGMEVTASAYGANRVALTAGTGNRLDEATMHLIRGAILADFEGLMRLSPGSFRDLGDPVDPADEGPLGALWPNGAPAPFGG